MFIQAALFTLLLAVISGEKCPNGGEIFVRGVSAVNQNDIVEAHNKYRNQIANGQVAGQPRGDNLKLLKWDSKLAKSGEAVSNSCKMQHSIASDGRFPGGWVGQNLYMAWSSVKSTNQDWAAAVKSWFDEHKNFKYPNKAIGGKTVGHYTQVVWADTYLIGCDFIAFYDASKPKYPYAKLYTCNYGPGGNVNKRAPYKIG